MTGKQAGVDDRRLLAVAIVAAWKAGRAVLDVYESDDFGVTRKSDDSPLTRADRLAHHIIVENLEGKRDGSEGAGSADSLAHYEPQTTSDKSLRTGHAHFPVLSEEGATIPYETRKQWHTLWMVDPLDGTKEFIKRNGEFTVNVALIRHHHPVLGVVYAPVPDRLYFGLEGLGSYRLDHARKHVSKMGRNGSIDSLITFSNRLPLSAVACGESGSSGTGCQSDVSAEHRTLIRRGGQNTEHGEARLRIVASRSHLNENTRAFIDNLRERYGEVELVQAGSSLKLCLVAEGSADIYPRLAPTMEWDTAAADAVVRAAGGRVTVHGSGDDLRYNRRDLLNPSFVVVGRRFQEGIGT